MQRMKTVLYFSIGVTVVGVAVTGAIMMQEEGFNWGTLALLGGTVIVVLIVLIPIIRLFNSQEVKNGVVAEATILKVWDTGTTINDNPLVGLLLEVHPNGLPAYQAETKTIVSRLSVANIQPGQTAKVQYDPGNLKRLAVVEFAPSQVNSDVSSLSERMEELEELHTRRLITESEYRQKREEILKTL